MDGADDAKTNTGALDLISTGGTELTVYLVPAISSCLPLASGVSSNTKSSNN